MKACGALHTALVFKVKGSQEQESHLVVYPIARNDLLSGTVAQLWPEKCKDCQGAIQSKAFVKQSVFVCG